MSIRSILGLNPTHDTHADDIDDVISSIDNSRRRRVIDYLANDPFATIGDLSEHIAVQENDVDDASQLCSDQRKRVYVGLYQTHLDRLDELDVVDFEKARGTIERGDRFDTAERVLEAIRREVAHGE